MKAPVHVVHVLEATEGGTRKWLENVVQGTDPWRIRHSCICSVHRDYSFLETVETFRRHGVDVWLVSMKRQINLLQDTRALLAIAAIFRTHRFDIIHAHSAKAGMLTRLAALAARTGPVIYSPHAFSFLMQGSVRHIYRIAEKLARSWTDFIMTVSLSERQLALGLGYPSERIAVVRNGVEIGPLHEEPVDVPPLVGFVGGLREQKDPLIFLTACARVHRQRPDVRYVLCGDGPMIASCKAFATAAGLQHVVTFNGWVNDIQQVLRRLSVFVSCSRYEGLSFALLEAMAAAKPIVGSRAPGNEEAIVHEETGLLFPVGDADALAEGILRLIEDHSLATCLGQRAREMAIAEFSLQDSLQQLTHFYETVAERSPRKDY